MSGSLWSARANDLLARTASADPTPGGGSIAAICGAFGLGLVQMALAVTGGSAHDAHRERAERLQAEIVPAADGDVADFAALMDAYALPRTDDQQRADRTLAVETATIAATEGPLALTAALVEALDLAAGVEPLVKRGIVSDVHAGRDLLIGAARAAIRTADINLNALEKAGSSAGEPLRRRRDELASRLEEA